MSSTPKTDAPETTRTPWRIRLALLVLTPLALIIFWECGHFARFGDFFAYGYNADLVLDHSNIGVPRVLSAYCLRLANYTLSPLKFGLIQTPTWGQRTAREFFMIGSRNGAMTQSDGSPS
jgi:hypothetical protein